MYNWESHKEEIYRLYIVEDSSITVVMKKMVGKIHGNDSPGPVYVQFFLTAMFMHTLYSIFVPFFAELVGRK